MDALKLKDTYSVLVDPAKATDSEKLVDSTNDTESEMSVDPAKNTDSEKLVDPAEDARTFIFLDETWVFRYGTGKTREWQDSSTRSVSVKKASSGPRYIVCHAGGRNGFVDGAGLFVNSSKKINPLDDYHGAMNAETFKEWFKTKLLPNLKEPSIIVMDNASYHSSKVFYN
ncbi:uncharacterized protein LOC123268117 [Cotesia glomerata]|uniref:uncharacterized protein LOC123268117 n=1 Tax=Cotesia glomerata TaxID=32391 RepID=UPI001D022F0A|nr:uncharacterized protein LOC123268117 [Cotesia glomerata]